MWLLLMVTHSCSYITLYLLHVNTKLIMYNLLPPLRISYSTLHSAKLINEALSVENLLNEHYAQKMLERCCHAIYQDSENHIVGRMFCSGLSYM